MEGKEGAEMIGRSPIFIEIRPRCLVVLIGIARLISQLTPMVFGRYRRHSAIESIFVRNSAE